MMVNFDKAELNLMKSVEGGMMDYDDLPNELQDKLFEHFLPEMPYGTAKARTGDPIQFILDHINEAIFTTEFQLSRGAH
jgi:hypothetical protein